MDQDTIATLEDTKDLLDQNFIDVRTKIAEFEKKKEFSEKTKIKNDILSLLTTIEENISEIRSNCANLTEDKNKDEWEEKLNNIGKEKEKIEEELSTKQIISKANPITDDEIDLALSNKSMSCRQAFDLGDRILDADDKLIGKMVKQSNEGKETMKKTNAELQRQSEKLDEAEKNLKDMDATLANAAVQLKKLFSIYATDKIIMSLLFLVVLAIIGVVVFSFIKKSSTSSNTPSDIFG